MTTSCSSGTYNSTTGLCETCPNGGTYNSGTNSCSTTTCSTGTYNPGANKCETCATGTYNLAANKCEICISVGYTNYNAGHQPVLEQRSYVEQESDDPEPGGDHAADDHRDRRSHQYA